MIHFGLKAIFIHIPRTAGNSISSELYKYPNFHMPGKHSDIRFFYNNYRKEFNTFFKFTCVRNPFEKVYSSYNFRKIKEKCNINNFNDWVKKHINRKDIYLIPQLNFISINNKIKCDYIIRYENLQNGFDYICKILGIERLKLPCLFPTHKSDYRKEYNNESIKIINKKFKKDIEYFNYEF